MAKVFSRPNKDAYFLAMASLVSLRATCRRRRVGCVLVDANNHVLATGYNGVARGRDHCLDRPCPGADFKPGLGLDQCEAIHAEQNAMLQCKDTQSIETAYITVSPCVTCVKLLMNTSCKRIVFIEPYVHNQAAELWKGEWIHYGTVEHVYAELRLAAAKGVPEFDERQEDLFGLRDQGSSLDGERSGRSEVRRERSRGESCD
jgi:dCMP deaminase